MQNIWD
jgi:NAD-dependent histone deacetylase SIR2